MFYLSVDIIEKRARTTAISSRTLKIENNIENIDTAICYHSNNGKIINTSDHSCDNNGHNNVTNLTNNKSNKGNKKNNSNNKTTTTIILRIMMIVLMILIMMMMMMIVVITISH